MINKIVISIFLIVFLTGCSKEKYVTCTNNVVNTNENYVLNSTIQLYHKNDKVTKIIVSEDYMSSDKNVLKYLKDYKNLYYENENDLYGGYTFEIKEKENHIILDMNINLNNLNIKKMVNDGKLDKYYTKQNTLTLTGAKYYYSSKGAVCE